MKINRKWLPFYLSRALIAALLGWVIAASSGLAWMGIVLGLLVFVGFIYYLHSGRYIVDEGHPLFPLRRDDRAETIRNNALVARSAARRSGLLCNFYPQPHGCFISDPIFACPSLGRRG